MVRVTRSASFLAALASAALPGLDPVSVQSVRPGAGDRYDVAYVVDSTSRRWVVQAPRTPVAGALLEDVTELCALLARRLDLAVPVVEGQVVVPEGRAVVYAALPGRRLDFSALPPGLGLAADLGRALAHIHNVEVELFDEAGRPSYDADTTRSRLLTDLDRAAETGHVPTTLLARWEHALEDISLWHFLPAPVHGSFTGAVVLASFEAEDDADSGRVSAILDWGQSHVGDPAEDFAELAGAAPPDALRAVLAAYGPSRVEVPDPALIRRASLLSELGLARDLLRATAAQEEPLVDEAVRRMTALDERLRAEARPPSSTRPARRPLRSETGDPSETREDTASPTQKPRITDPDVATVAMPLTTDLAGELADGTADDVEHHSGAVGQGPPGDGEAPPEVEHHEWEDDVARGEAPADEMVEGHDVEGDAVAGDEIEEDGPAQRLPDRDEHGAAGHERDDAGDGLLDLHEGASEFVPVTQSVEHDRTTHGTGPHTGGSGP